MKNVEISGVYFEIKDKTCSPKTMLTVKWSTLLEAKRLCSIDPSCFYFYEMPLVLQYWKCSADAKLEIGPGNTLYYKGINKGK